MVYNDGKNCIDAGIIKYLVVRVFKARVTTVPGWLEFKPNKVLYSVMNIDTLLNGERLAA